MTGLPAAPGGRHANATPRLPSSPVALRCGFTLSSEGESAFGLGTRSAFYSGAEMHTASSHMVSEAVKFKTQKGLREDQGLRLGRASDWPGP